VLGTLIIAFHHLPDYAGNFYNLDYFGVPINLGYVNVLNTYLGLGLFVFTSGFVLCYSRPIIDRIGVFLKERVVRIFPLYWVALGLFALLYPGEMNLSDIVLHVFGLQIAAAPRFAAPVSTLWFVGLIVMFYLIYAVWAKYATGYKGTAALMVLVLGVSVAIRCVFQVIEYRFFVYFPIFVSGVMCGRVGLFTRLRVRVWHVVVALAVLVVSVLVLRAYHKGPIYDYGEVTEVFVAQAPFLDIVAVSSAIDAFVLAWVFVAFAAARSLVKLLSKTTVRLLEFVSFSSYGVFLFHRPIWNTLASGLRLDSNRWMLLFLVVVGLPLIVIVSYGAQVLSDKLVKCLGIVT